MRIQAQPTGTPVGPDSYAHCSTLYALGLCLRDTRQPTIAEERFREALALLEKRLAQAPDNVVFLRLHANLFNDLGFVLMQQGKFVPVREAYVQALKEFRIHQDMRNVVVVLQRLGLLSYNQGQYSVARKQLLQALEQFEALGEPAAQADTWYILGYIALSAKDLVEAERCLRESLAIREHLGNVADAADCCNVLAQVAERDGRTGEAEGWYQGALRRIERVEPDWIRHASCLGNLANLLTSEVQVGRAPKTRLVDARRYAEQSLRIEEQPGVSTELWKTLGILARIAEIEEDEEVARTYRRRECESYAAFAGNRTWIDQQYGSLIAAITQAARGNQVQRASVEEMFPQLEQAGWHIRAAVEHNWAGERDWHTLADELDPEGALLILRVLETLGSPADTATPKEEA